MTIWCDCAAVRARVAVTHLSHAANGLLQLIVCSIKHALHACIHESACEIEHV